MIPLLPTIVKIVASSRLVSAFPLVRRTTLEAVIRDTREAMDFLHGQVGTMQREVNACKRLVDAVIDQRDILSRSNRMLREQVLGAKNVGRFRGDFEPGNPRTSSAARFGTAKENVDNGSVAAITAVALRKFNEIILLQADFEAIALDEQTLEFNLGGERWNVVFSPAKMEN